MSDLFKLTGSHREALRAELSTLTTEAVAEDLRNLDTLPTDRIVALMNEQDQGVPLAVAKVLPQIGRAIDEIAARMRAGGRLVYVGAGTPGRLGILDASECPPTFNTDPSLVVAVMAGGDGAIRVSAENVEDDPQGGAEALEAIGLDSSDSVIGISASGRTPFVVGALEHARDRDAVTVAVACNADSLIGRVSRHAIEVVVGPEVVAGSTRLKAGTAQKLVLNMISTIVMIRLGKTYGNIMVDLRTTNEKLRVRAERAVMLVTGCSPGDAERALSESKGSVKTAILMLSRGLTPERAAEILAEAPSLRAALSRVQ